MDSRGEASPAIDSGAEAVPAGEIGFAGQGAAGDASPLRRLLQEGADG